MAAEKSSMKCEGCGRDLSDLKDPSDLSKRIPCPDCGSTIRHHYSTIECVIVMSPSASAKAKDPDGFVKQEESVRESYSNKSGRRVTIIKSIDRTDPKITAFHHKVEEYDEHGIIKKTIHDHTDTFPAKHRKEK